MKIITVQRAHKQNVVEVLCASFKDEHQTQYIIGKGGNEYQRLHRLMCYAFEQCMVNGNILMTEDKKAVALWRNHRSKKMSFRLLLENILFLFTYGFARLSRITTMEKSIQQHYPAKKEFAYLWMFATLPSCQGQGYGSALLAPSMQQAALAKKDVLLETTSQQNLDFYAKKGFKVYKKVFINGYSEKEICLLKKENF